MRRSVVLVVRVVSALLALGALGLAAAVYWFFYAGTPAPANSPALDLAELRAEAATFGGARATRIEVETLSHTPTPEIAMVAGTRWTKVDLVRNSYRVVFPDRTVIVETGDNRQSALRFGARAYDDEAWLRVLAAIAAADAIVLTHGHGDHASGLLASAGVDGVAQKALVSAAQINTMRSGGLGAEAFSPTLAYTDKIAIAPGVVLVAAPGHTPDSQLVYVQLADGQEYLFMGDTASMAGNVMLGRIRSRYVTDRIGNDVRSVVAAHTAALRQLVAAHPDLVLVPGHDGAAIAGLEARGVLVRGFSPAP